VGDGVDEGDGDAVGVGVTAKLDVVVAAIAANALRAATNRPHRRRG
jgi:hypothetical protein